ncbi:MAG: DUF2442 domain-containing protein [Bacteroidales bacterium]|nr:DUF2442 domain-containing protein [Bacteroidales bacterium]
MKIEKIWLTDDAVWVRRDDGAVASESFSNYPRLRLASSEQRACFIVDDFGVRWPELDEDLLFEEFFRHKPKTDLRELFMSHPELNASAVARRMGISQSLFAQYISGTKKPSEKRLEEIFSTIRAIGFELMSLRIDSSLRSE